MPSARPFLPLLAAAAAALALPCAAQTVQDYVRLEGRMGTRLRGVGFVVGLPGTGDSAKELLVARPLAEIYRNNGIQIDTIDELAKGKSAALVMLEVEIAGPAKAGDRLDVSVAVSHNAPSIRGGRLVLSALSGPLPGQGVYAFGSGPVTLDDPLVPTHGRVRMGAEIIRDIAALPVGDTFDLVLQPYAEGHAAASALASQIEEAYYVRPTDDLVRIATPIDDRTIRIDIPPAERADRVGFLGLILAARVEPTLLRLPPRVVVNQASGQIVMTADVRIGPVAIADETLTITTVVPPPVPTPESPLLERTRMAPVQTGQGRPAEQGRLQDLLDAFKQLDIPVKRQIQTLQMMKGTGSLHAELIIE